MFYGYIFIIICFKQLFFTFKYSLNIIPTALFIFIQNGRVMIHSTLTFI